MSSAVQPLNGQVDPVADQASAPSTPRGQPVTPTQQADTPLFSKKTKTIAKCLLAAGGAVALAVATAKSTALATALSTAADKVGGAFSGLYASVGVNMAVFGGVAAVAGLLHTIQGVNTSRRGSKGLEHLKADYRANSAQRDQNAFGRLKVLYRQVRARGRIQAALGVGIAVVGVVALAGAMSNPIGLGVVLGTALALVVAVYAHKWYISRKMKIAENQYYVQGAQRPQAALIRP
ncbi:MAG TPA: hypothetical protein VGE55_05380 [Limnobacter sp.]|uniref:hypothetical protein n=1 Tax=Limnobacter sp. TaxID=2003368 RepID=UPI002ED8B013